MPFRALAHKLNFERPSSLYTDRFLPLTSDFVFKVFFTNNPDLFGSLLNACLDFGEGNNSEENNNEESRGGNVIKKLSFLNSVLTKETQNNKTAILDIHARDNQGRSYNSEMQAYHHKFFPERTLYYWSRIFGTHLQAGQPYDLLKPAYSISFLNFNLFRDRTTFHSTFRLYDQDGGKSRLTEIMELHFFELPKFRKTIYELKSNLDWWIYFIKNAHLIMEDKVQEEIIMQEAPDTIQTAVNCLRALSEDPVVRLTYESQLKAERDEIARRQYAEEEAQKRGLKKGLDEGIKKGMDEGIKKGMDEGLKRGMNEGMQEGLQEGLKQGRARGKLEGKLEGKKEGKREGILDGRILEKLSIIKKLLKVGAGWDLIAATTDLNESEYHALLSKRD